SFETKNLIIKSIYSKMKTKFKPNISDEYLKFGVYFKSENDITTQYLIELCEGKFEENILVKIYRTDILENHFKTDGLINGCLIGIPKYETEWISEVELYGKYFFPYNSIMNYNYTIIMKNIIKVFINQIQFLHLWM